MILICDELKAIAYKCGYTINGDTIQDLLRSFNSEIDKKQAMKTYQQPNNTFKKKEKISDKD